MKGKKFLVTGGAGFIGRHRKIDKWKDMTEIFKLS